MTLGVWNGAFVRQAMDDPAIAFAAALSDPDLKADAEKGNLPVEYVSAKEVEETVDKILDMPPDVQENLGFLVRRKK